ncbi:MAG: DUF4238 domain-containing protein [Paracoccaceae bacterium]
MTSLKNQHFVPQFYLRNFSEDENRKAIRLYNIRGRKVIHRAPIKNQCSKDFFYGQGGVEEALSSFEGVVSKIIRRMESLGLGCLSVEDRLFLLVFLVLQERRTASALEDLRRFEQGINAHIEKSPHKTEDLFPTGGLNAVENILIAFQIYPSIYDLDWRMLRFKGGHRLITSDNPVVIYNKAGRQGKLPDSIGLQSAGIIIYFPLSPDSALLLFDSGIYKLPGNKGGDIRVNRQGDIRNLNMLSACNSLVNFYFSKDIPFSRNELDLISELHSRDRWRTDEFVMISEANGIERYRRMKDNEMPKGTTIVLSGKRSTEFNITLSFIKYRTNMKYDDTGTGAGVLRDRAMHDLVDRFQKEVKSGKRRALSFPEYVCEVLRQRT